MYTPWRNNISILQITSFEAWYWKKMYWFRAEQMSNIY